MAVAIAPSRDGARLVSVIAALHAAALAVLVLAPGLWSLGLVAYALGLRHAFDVDHIAAIDNVTRKLWHDGRRPVFAGFFFSLGHSTVVVALSLALVITLHHTRLDMASLGAWGNILGGFVSAAFLTLIGVLNAAVLVQSLRASHGNGAVKRDGDADLQRLFQGGGVLSRLLGGVYRYVDTSWKMYPLGFLFGLGFDTATEIAILGLSAVASGNAHLSLWMVMAFPLLFAAGMTLVDSIDGVMLLRAYQWSMRGSRGRGTLNLLVTGTSVAAALTVAALEWLQLLSRLLPGPSDIRQALGTVDFALLGAVVTATLMLSWGIFFVYRLSGKPHANGGPTVGGKFSRDRRMPRLSRPEALYRPPPPPR